MSATMDGSAGKEKRSRRLRRFAFVVIVLAAAASIVAARRPAATIAAAPAPAPATAALKVRTISNDATYDGVVIHAVAMPIITRTSGRLTSAAAEGTTIAAGQSLFEVDARPTVLLLGDTPAWRDLSFASTPGPDVKQLQDNLVTLGFDPGHEIVADGTFSDATASAIIRWQEQLGVTATGSVTLGSVLFEPSPIIVGVHQVEVGASVAPGTALADAQLAAVTMQFTLPADARSVIAIGQAVDVTMPDRSSAKATFASIGTATDATSGATITVGRGTIDAKPSATAITDLATIKVRVSQTIGDQVLVAPAAALTSHVDGTFTVTVLHPDGSTKVVPVKVGVAANGTVAITGDGVAADTKVLVPSNA
jgi:peptidoglycan hydrolase-like protein with peptidoglycan-binding domain